MTSVTFGRFSDNRQLQFLPAPALLSTRGGKSYYTLDTTVLVPIATGDRPTIAISSSPGLAANCAINATYSDN